MRDPYVSAFLICLIPNGGGGGVDPIAVETIGNCMRV